MKHSIAGDVIEKYYFPIFIPVGVVGNILSFLVSTDLIFLLRLKNSFTTFRLNCTTFGLLNLFIIYWPISAIEAKTLITSCILLEFSKSVYRIMFFPNTKW